MKVGLGQLAADGVPLPANWALAWVENDLVMGLRTPAHRCREEFKKLFYIKYHQKFGEGCILKVNKTKLKIVYKPASASFRGIFEIDFSNLPNVTKLKQPKENIYELVNSCVDELDSYSRYLGRNPDKKDSLEALALLPNDILSEQQKNELNRFSGWLKNTVKESSFVETDANNLFSHFALSDQIRKKDVVTIVQMLEKLRFGLEPDVRFGSPLPKTDKVILFKLPEDSPSVPSSEYSAAMLLLHLGVAIAHADGTVSDEEEQQLENQLETLFKLSPPEKERLKAYTKWLICSPPSFAGMKKKLEKLNQDQREIIGEFLVEIAQADGIIDASEIKMLKKVYSILGIDEQKLYSQAHAAATEPITIQEADRAQKGFAIPPPQPKEGLRRVELDIRSIEQKLAETAKVASILRDIFQDEEDIQLQPVEDEKIEDVLRDIRKYLKEILEK
jgi:uncharacterized tellurite resistance protein B-like protein